jgi:hypothetical protein
MLYELQVGSTDWANITPYVHSLRQVTQISRGVPGEYSQASPSECSFSINNASGLFSPRNPLSPLYGMIGKNTPVRVSIGQGQYGMVTSGADNSGGSATTTDKAQLDITGDMDFRVDLELRTPKEDDTWTASSWLTGNFDLASKFADSDPNRSWTFILIGGKLKVYWFSAGTTASMVSATSTVALSGSPQDRRALRFTIDVNNGASGNTVTFYTAPTMAGPWTQLGAQVTQAGVTSIFNGAGNLRIGGAIAGSIYTWAEPPYATFYSAELRNGLGGTLVANPVFTTQPLDPVPFSTSDFPDGLGNQWFLSGTADAARIWYGDVDIRHWGESSSFPNRWDTSGNDAWVPITSTGILRRLGQNQEPAQTGLQAWVESQLTLPVSYFPLTGAEGTTYSLNRGRVGKNRFKFFPENQIYLVWPGSPTPATKPIYTYGKDWGVPWLSTGMEYNASGNSTDLRADVGVADDNFTLDFVFQSPVINSDSGTQNTNIGVFGIYVWTYDNDRWYLQLQKSTNDGTLQVTWYANDGVGSITFPSAGPIAALLDNELHTCRFELSTTGGGTTQTYSVYIDGTLVSSNTATTGRPINGTSLYQMYYSRYAGQTVFNLGHLTGWSGPTFPNAPLVTEFAAAALGYVGETAGDRITRICALNNIPFKLKGNAADTIPMGAQYAEPRLTQIRDAENTDMGYLLEPRGAFGLKYRTRVSMTNQIPGLTLNYAAGAIVPPFEPTDDDQLIKNDMTVTRRDGGSSRVQLTSGHMSIQEPPTGVGQYADQTTVNPDTDAALDGIAAWLVALGTIDQARYPSVTVDLGILTALGQDDEARALDTGDLLIITNMSELGVYDDVRLLVLGVANETISDGAFKHTITWNCMPYAAYESSVYAVSAAAGNARYDTAGSTLTAAVTISATTFQVSDTGGTLWTTDPAAFPLDVTIGGERMTVGAISGASSPQTFSSVTRAVNGVSRAHSAGEDVRLTTPAKYSL